MAARNCDFKTALREAAEWLGVSLNGNRDAPLIFPTLEAAIAFAERKLKMRATRRDWYHDRNGKEHFVVVRFDGADKKDFRPFSRNGSGWIVKDPPGKLPLFRLPELIARKSERVFVVEGEKPVCELATLGLLVTSSAHGAKSAHKTDWQPLAGREVVILPDNDAEGRVYAQTVAGILIGYLHRPKFASLNCRACRQRAIAWIGSKRAMRKRLKTSWLNSTVLSLKPRSQKSSQLLKRNQAPILMLDGIATGFVTIVAAGFHSTKRNLSGCSDM